MKNSVVWRSAFAALLASACSQGNGEQLGSTKQELDVGDSHLLAVVGGGGLRHSLRTGEAGTPWGDVESAAGEIGTVARVAAVDAGHLQVVAMTNFGKMFHSLRNVDTGAWTPFSDVALVAGNIGTVTSVSLAQSLLNKVYLCATSGDGRAWLAARRVDGSWEGFQPLKVLTNSDPGTFNSISCAIHGVDGPDFQNGFSVYHDNLHVVATTTAGRVFHALKQGNNAWTAFGDVSAATGSTSSYFDVDASVDDGFDLHVVATGSGRQHHTIRNHLDGSWKPFGDIASVAGDPGREGRGAVGVIFNSLHVYVVTNTGGLFRAIRLPGGNIWNNYIDMKNGSAESMVDVAFAPHAFPPIEILR